jgi:putative tryptophan/tyrosine transport system substrate-binding protein
LVASLSRPGGTVTGVSQLITELTPKRVEALLSAVPTAKLIALLSNPANPVIAKNETRQAQESGKRLGLEPASP